MIENKLELFPEESQIGEPLFRTHQEYENFRIDFQNSVREELIQNSVARRRSIEQLLLQQN